MAASRLIMHNGALLKFFYKDDIQDQPQAPLLTYNPLDSSYKEQQHCYSKFYSRMIRRV